MIIGIVGYGFVGQGLARVFGYTPDSNEVRIYDKFRPEMSSVKYRAAIQECDLVFVAVPAPEGPGGKCDVSAVGAVVTWVKPPICLKSTVPPGTVDRLAKTYGKRLSFSPEYVGETRWHPWRAVENDGFVIVGGEESVCDIVIRAYQAHLGPSVRYYITDAKTAELCKYMDNCFLATKVAFVNQFYDLARAYGVNYNELRELWLADERVGRSHTMVTSEGGFRGRCLPKDIAALMSDARALGGAPLLEAVDQYNDQVCRRADEGRAASPLREVQAVSRQRGPKAG
jgi:UDPglucose 6-dehydrogenase